jgi:hypothetical protein
MDFCHLTFAYTALIEGRCSMQDIKTAQLAAKRMICQVALPQIDGPLPTRQAFVWSAYRDGAACWAWVPNLILLHNFKVFALKIKRGTLALLDQQ